MLVRVRRRCIDRHCVAVRPREEPHRRLPQLLAHHVAVVAVVVVGLLGGGHVRHEALAAAHRVKIVKGLALEARDCVWVGRASTIHGRGEDVAALLRRFNDSLAADDHFLVRADLLHINHRNVVIVLLVQHDFFLVFIENGRRSNVSSSPALLEKIAGPLLVRGIHKVLHLLSVEIVLPLLLAQLSADLVGHELALHL